MFIWRIKVLYHSPFSDVNPFLARFCSVGRAWQSDPSAASPSGAEKLRQNLLPRGGDSWRATHMGDRQRKLFSVKSLSLVQSSSEAPFPPHISFITLATLRVETPCRYISAMARLRALSIREPRSNPGMMGVKGVCAFLT